MGQAPAAGFPPVLCYHRVGGPLELGVTRVARSTFARQMTTLARAGWKTLTLGQFAERLRHEHSAFRTPHSEFLLTLDDGYASLGQHVYPVLADVGFTATTFLITDYVGRLNTWDVRYTWHVGRVPFGLRQDAIGSLGRFVADVANRCAVGTSVMLNVSGRR